MHVTAAGSVGSPIPMATSGGPHPPDKWAGVAASLIGRLIVIDEESTSLKAAEARHAKPLFEINVARVLEPYFDLVMVNEDQQISLGTVTSRIDPYTVEQYVPDALAAVSFAALDTPFQTFFSSDIPRFLPLTDKSPQATVAAILTQLFLDAANVQRLWAFDQKGH